MINYFFRRILQMIPSLLGITLIVFILLTLSGDPVKLYLPEDATSEQIQNLRIARGLDQPILIQYLKTVLNMATGNFGESIRYTNQPVSQIVLERLPATLELTVSALIVAVSISLPAGILAAIKRNSIADRIISTLAVIGRAMPIFWVGILLSMIFSTKLNIFPVSGREGFKSIILPSLTLGIALSSLLMRLLRSSLLEVMNQDYIRTSRAKGLSNFMVISKHALRNAILPYLTVFGLELASLLGGAVVTEQVFAWPGVGLLAIQAINSRDMAIVQAIVMLTAIIVMSINLLIDLVYALIDPRIKYT